MRYTYNLSKIYVGLSIKDSLTTSGNCCIIYSCFRKTLGWKLKMENISLLALSILVKAITL